MSARWSSSSDDDSAREEEAIAVVASIDELRREIAALRTDVRDLRKVCSRMDDHITFVNGTYNAVRSPMSWIFARVNRMMGVAGPADLPRIEGSADRD